MGTLYKSNIWVSDLDRTIHSMPFLDRLAGKIVMLTGAGGLICSSAVDLLLRYNDTHAKQIYVIAAGRNPDKLKKRFAPYTASAFLSIIRYDATSVDNHLPPKCDYIIHGAGNAYPAIISKEPVETMLSGLIGLSVLLEYSRNRKIERLVYISSGEVYGLIETNQPLGESDYGYIDLLNPRSSYSVGKRAAETLCTSYLSEYGVQSLTVRPCHVYGPTASASDNRVASAWAYSAARNEPIILKSDGRQTRSLCYCLDSAAALLSAMIYGQIGDAYNIAPAGSAISIRELAELISSQAGVEMVLKLPSQTERRGFNPMDNAVLDGKKLHNLGWCELFDIETGISHTIEILREILS